MVYESMKQCATKTGTDYKLIKAAKGNKDAPGFNVGGSGLIGILVAILLELD